MKQLHNNSLGEKSMVGYYSLLLHFFTKEIISLWQIVVRVRILA